ncbi:MAG: NUDIX hydrolase [bacterium]
MSDPAEMRRPVARVLLLDPSDRLLMLFDDSDEERGPYWYPPGGRIEDGETPQQAARRELLEEIGVDAVIGPLVLRRRARFTYRGRHFDQDEWHFVAHTETSGELVSRAGDNEQAAVAAHRWWSLADLEASHDRMFPEDLTAVLKQLAEGALPAHNLAPDQAESAHDKSEVPSKDDALD